MRLNAPLRLTVLVGIGVTCAQLASAQGVMEMEADQGATYSPYDELQIEAQEQPANSWQSGPSVESLDGAPAPQTNAPEPEPAVDSERQSDGEIDPFSLEAGESQDEAALSSEQDYAPKSDRPAVTPQQGTTATLRALDKVTGRISEFKVGLTEPYIFGTLEIGLRYCEKAPPEETPEVAAFLQIDEQRRDTGEAERRFSGWMYASSPSVSAMEHPIYDIWVIDCSAIAPSHDFGNE